MLTAGKIAVANKTLNAGISLCVAFDKNRIYQVQNLIQLIQKAITFYIFFQNQLNKPPQTAIYQTYLWFLSICFSHNQSTSDP